jgi:preprotein translocase subunit SecG
MFYTIFLMVHVLLALAMVGLILIQQGKGADAGAAFGSGASSTVFGARGSGSFLTRTTAILAVLFFANSLLLAYLVTTQSKSDSVVESVLPRESIVPHDEIPAPTTAPASDLPDMPDVPDVPGVMPAETPADDAPASEAPTDQAVPKDGQ